MQKQIKSVEDFQKAFGQVVNNKPDLVPVELAKLRFDLMKEENEEYLQAAQEGDLTAIADALTDKLYILCGTILTHGFQHIIEKCFEEVHNSNMSKLDDTGHPLINGQNGVLDKTKPLGKVLKSSNFTEPNLTQFLKNN